jgi:hypothetical protein
LVELHFYKSQESPEKIEEGAIIIEDGIPRLESFKRGATILDMKKQIARKFAPNFYHQDLTEKELDIKVNEAIEFSVEDNLPNIAHGSKGLGP